MATPTQFSSLALAATLVMVASQTHAHNLSFDNHCDLSLNNELTITPQHILISQDDKTLIDIYKDEQIFLRGEQLDLSPEQQKLVTQYAQTLRNAVPDVVEIATEAVDVAFEGVNAGLGSMINMEENRQHFDQIKQRIAEKYDGNNGHYRFSDGNFSTDIDGTGIDEAVDELVEDMLPKIIGSVLAQVGTSMAQGDMDFSQFDNLDQRIDLAIDERAHALEKKADAFCRKLKAADEIEETLLASDLKFAELDLLHIKQHHP